MDQSKALNTLLEAVDLVGMIEDLTDPARSETLSPSIRSGMRITLRNVREAIIASHKIFAAELVNRSRASAGNTNAGQNLPQDSAPASANAGQAQFTRRSLKANLERVVE